MKEAGALARIGRMSRAMADKASHIDLQRMPLKPLVALAGVAVAAGTLGRWAWNRFGPATYVRMNTMFGKARIYEVADDAGDPVRLLEVGGIVQSGTYTDDRYADLVFEYLKAYDVMFERNPHIQRVCVLGCGGYDYPEHLVAHHDPVAVDAVEIDPTITALAKRYFFLDRIMEEYGTDESGRLNLICADALEYLESTGLRYDAIVNDSFDAGTPPAHLTGERFARAVCARLRPGGLYLTNIVSAVEGPRSAFLREQVALLEAVFESVEVIPCAHENLTDEDNVVVVARAHRV